MTSEGRFEKFTKEAKQALMVAQETAKQMTSSYVGTEHLLIGVLSQQSSLGASILNEFGVSLGNVELVLKSVGRVTSTQMKPGQQGGLSGFAKKVIEDAVKCAHEHEHSFVGTEHLLFAVVSQENTAATVILENMKVSTNDIKGKIAETFDNLKSPAGAMTGDMNKTAGGGKRSSAGNPADMQKNGMNPLEFFLSGLHGVLQANNNEPQEAYEKAANKPADTQQKGTATPALDYFTTDMTKECREGKLGPVIGRSSEIERMVSILQRKTKNNPVLIGEPGVGKTAVAEGLAYAIVNEEVPTSMLDKKILSLSMASVVAGTKYRGEFEERIKQIIDEATTLDNVILFIDELHTVVGAGSAEGSLDAANILKPALSRSKIQMIGATTLNDYSKHIEPDTALERRFQPIVVGEPNAEDSLEILRGLRESFEDHHNLLITDDALESAVTLSHRYINDRFLPDKAIDLVDEAAALKVIKSPQQSNSIKGLQKDLKKINKDKEIAVSNQEYEAAAQLRSQELKLMEEINEAKRVKIPRSQRESIDADDVAKVIERMTGIPVSKLLQEDAKKLKNLEEKLGSVIIGQEEAIHGVAQAIRRSRTGIGNHKRPIGAFMFMGPTGVGKTELVKQLAKQVYDNEHALIKIDMSEFMERHNTSRLTGTTAGYVGYEEGGQLTEKIRKQPYSIVLFDEVEKAHPDVFNILLQIMEDGELTDGKGRKVDFKNTIIIMTSNIGSEELTNKAAKIGFSLSKDELNEAEEAYEEKKAQVLEKMKEHFKPEFINRLDGVLVFRPLTHDQIKQIVKLHIAQIEERLSEKNIHFNVSDKALEHLANVSYDPEYGARPVRRKLQEIIEDQFSDLWIDGKIKEGDTINIGLTKEKITLSTAKATVAAKK
ncbi:MAG: ATP-dependent Clp protease ATP-binding subunit [Candidatus Peregrinibacteria bacterium]|nr:ATP-dependent Clp protease ATP-binding subunit [Candidatus Peregrinibacteria bacterium]MDZ4244748.1 ATP-dependent Clp protease ATP-binding subunit [Candidatus Gracilibacteria bacterium]